MESNKSLLMEFVTETKDHLESLEEDFLALETQKNNPDRELIDKVFRVIHTIKGNAGFFQLKNIDELSHIMETILLYIRSGKITPGPDVIDALLDGIDTVNELLLDIRKSDEENISGQLDTLRQILIDRGIDQTMGEISLASKEQSEGIEQINNGLDQIDQVTQSNTANAEESASAAEQLASQAQQLKTLISQFKLAENGHKKISKDVQFQVSDELVHKLVQEEIRRLKQEEQGVGNGDKTTGVTVVKDPRIKPEDVISLDDDNYGKF